MTEYAGLAQLPHAIMSITTLIDRHADRYYAEEVAEHFDRTRPESERPSEEFLLDLFNDHVEKLLDYEEAKKIPQRRDSLVFAHIYTAAERPTADGDDSEHPPIAVLTALLAAEFEFRGPRRLSRIQNMRLAETYEDLGRSLIASDLPEHAALAFKRAVGLHRLEEDFDAQDRCGLALAQARCRSISPTWRRIPYWTLEVLCGYGFRPFRLLFWIAAILLIGTVVLRLTDSLPIATTLHMCLINYLNPLGRGDLDDVKGAGRTLLIVEAYCGLVFNSLFFALLVRRWFRI
ncbi:hypothetical protein ACQP0C_08895 [Nocardia sp. CA-129566]|uniref:hypothetical protein n=1 Tax=Nocardia sp. CA-129566 TaxID=3239976 RepID=UPI003D988F06